MEPMGETRLTPKRIDNYKVHMKMDYAEFRQCSKITHSMKLIENNLLLIDKVHIQHFHSADLPCVPDIASAAEFNLSDQINVILNPVSNTVKRSAKLTPRQDGSYALLPFLLQDTTFALDGIMNSEKNSLN
ncbi:hypothetical protein CEXT_265371 [Caerostris extrusa]|uniref:Uncharacterized protein n=1 Tax=Caerostris extrusa TaxID=172846 RepID=A0AAV4V4Q2_CAEEX|nr:hypothetical protein CEXT_265371 [Caerostris extrusa]